MKRIVILVITVVGLLGAFAVGAVFMYMDSIARTAIERGGTFALGVDVHLARADVQPFAGRFDMQQFRVHNPAGFGSKPFMDLRDGGVAVTLSSLRSDTVELGELKLSGLHMRLQRDGAKSNYGVILDNLKRFESGETTPQEDSGTGKKFVIRQVDLEDITVSVATAPLPADIPITVEKLQLRNVGTAGKPVDMSELVGVLLKAVLRAATEVGGDLLPEELLGDLDGALAELRRVDVENIVHGVQQQAREKLGQAAEDLGKQIDDKLGEESRKLGEGLKKLLPPKRDDDGD